MSGPFVRPYASRQAAYDEITSTAMRLFLDQGFEQTTIDQIAPTAGISQRALPWPRCQPLTP